MTPEVVTVPHLAHFIQVDWAIDWRSQSSGTGNSGNNQFVYNAFPRFVGRPQVHLHRSEIAEWRSILASVKGRANVLRMPMVDPAGFDYIRAAELDGVNPATGISFSTGEPFSTGYGFRYTPLVLAAEAAAQGATEIVVDESSTAASVSVGQFLSYDDWPMVVRWRQAEGSNYRLGVEPSLRTAIAAGEPISLLAYGRFQVIEANTFPLPYQANQVSTPRFALVEWLNR